MKRIMNCLLVSVALCGMLASTALMVRSQTYPPPDNCNVDICERPPAQVICELVSNGDPNTLVYRKIYYNPYRTCTVNPCPSMSTTWCYIIKYHNASDCSDPGTAWLTHYDKKCN
jgi:hypothetical protein